MKTKILLLCFFIPIFCSCEQEIPILSLGLQEEYYIPRMSTYRFTPGYTGENYRWTMQLPNGQDSLLSTEQYYSFVQKDEGIYNLTFEIIDPQTPYKYKFRVEVMHEYIEYSPYISKVFEYCPAPGQFVNEMPKYESGDTEESMRKKAEEN
ncbi:MAG: cell surface protein, partial [Dysgonamonadaceae bacterium]|nr:cell surface protein [Dysgonamonadaceae bacterium]